MSEPHILQSSAKRIRIVTQAPDNYMNSFVMNSPIMMNSPIIRTPHDSQTIDEFKGIFTVRAPPAAYSPCKNVVMDYQMSPVKRVLNPLPLNSTFIRIPDLSKDTEEETSVRGMWWMDENEEVKGESWLKEDKVEELLDTTEDDKKKFFEALLNNEINPEFSDSDNEKDDQELLDSINDLNSQIEKLSSNVEYSMDFVTEDNQSSQQVSKHAAQEVEKGIAKNDQIMSQENSTSLLNDDEESRNLNSKNTDKSSELRKDQGEIVSSSRINSSSADSVPDQILHDSRDHSSEDIPILETESVENLKNLRECDKMMINTLENESKMEISNKDQIGEVESDSDMDENEISEVNNVKIVENVSAVMASVEVSAILLEDEPKLQPTEIESTPVLRLDKDDKSTFCAEDIDDVSDNEDLSDTEQKEANSVLENMVSEVYAEDVESSINVDTESINHAEGKVEESVGHILEKHGESVDQLRETEMEIHKDGESVEQLKKTEIEKDGESVEQLKKTEIDKDGESVEQLRETEIQFDEDGESVEQIREKELESDRSRFDKDREFFAIKEDLLTIPPTSINHVEPRTSSSLDSHSQSPRFKKKEIAQEEFESIKVTIRALEDQVMDLQNELTRKENENDTLKRENSLLENILAKEQANSKRLLSRIGGSNQSDINHLRKEIEEQERLIHGYQLENEKLLDLNKDLKMQIKEAEKKETLKSEKLLRDISALKTQLSERDRFQTRSELGVATYQLQIETLEQELQSVKSSALETRDFQRAEIEKLKALLKEANKSKIRPEINSNFENSKEYLELKDKYDIQILELEQKLKWLTEDQANIDELRKTISTKDIRIKELEEAMEKLGLNPSIMKDLRRRSLVDIQKINSLESEIKKLKNSGGKTNSEESLKSDKSPPPEKAEIENLKTEIARLKDENENLSKDSEKRIESLQKEFNGLRAEYEKNLKHMEENIKEREDKNDNALTQKIEDLEFALAEKEKQLKLSEESNGRRRVLELESLLDEQSNKYLMIIQEKSEIKEQLIKLTREREKLIDSYETQVDEMEKALKDKIFAVQDSKYLDEINDLKLKRESDRREIMDLKTRLEISEKTRSSVQDATLVILKQAQEESAKIALAHHERSLQSFLSEMKAETGQKSRQEEAIESQLSDALKTIDQLQKTIFDLECKNASLSDKVTSLSAQLSSLQATNMELQNTIDQCKKSWPPSQQTFEGLRERIRELEASSKKRELDIVNLLEECRNSANQEFAQEKSDLLQILNRKDAEIISFKQELESLMGMIIRLKNDQKF